MYGFWTWLYEVTMSRQALTAFTLTSVIHIMRSLSPSIAVWCLFSISFYVICHYQGCSPVEKVGRAHFFGPFSFVENWKSPLPVYGPKFGGSLCQCIPDYWDWGNNSSGSSCTTFDNKLVPTCPINNSQCKCSELYTQV